MTFQPKILALTATAALLSACENTYDISEQQYKKYMNKDIRMVGVVKLKKDTDDKPKLEMRYFRDEDYRTVILTQDQQIGQGLEHEGDSAEFHVPTTQIRLGRTEGQYPIICAEFRVEDSNYPEWSKAGCLYAE